MNNEYSLKNINASENVSNEKNLHTQGDYLINASDLDNNYSADESSDFSSNSTGTGNVSDSDYINLSQITASIRLDANRKVRRSRKKKFTYPNGYLKITYGPMYSGKSSELKSDKNDWQAIKNIKMLIINHAQDKRYTDESMVMTHNKEGVECISVEKLEEITNGTVCDKNGVKVLPNNYDVILVDEGQFYVDLVENVINWVDVLKKSVFVYGLVGNFNRQKFGDILNLIPSADKIVQKTAFCTKCNNGTNAIFTWKLENNDDDASVPDIGSTDKYVSLCRRHYNMLNKPKI